MRELHDSVDQAIFPLATTRSVCPFLRLLLPSRRCTAPACAQSLQRKPGSTPPDWQPATPPLIVMEVAAAETRAMDPRWQVKTNRAPDAASAAAAALQQQPRQNLAAAGGAQQQQRTGASDEASDSDRQQASFSIVFLAAWVAIIAPIGEGAFSRVYEGVYTNPQVCAFL